MGGARSLEGGRGRGGGVHLRGRSLAAPPSDRQVRRNRSLLVLLVMTLPRTSLGW